MAEQTVEEKKRQAIEYLNRLLQNKSIPQGIHTRAVDEMERVGEPAITKWYKASTDDLEELKRPAEPKFQLDLVSGTNPISREIQQREIETSIDFGNIGYMTRAIIIASMPRSKPKGLEFKRKNGDYYLLMSVPNQLHEHTGIELPFGTIPRLIFLWLCTEVTRSKSQFIHLGNTRSEFIRNIGLVPRTGKNGNMEKCREQLTNMLGTMWSAWKANTDETSAVATLDLHHRPLVSDAKLWWDQKNSNFDAFLELDQKFYQELLHGGIPVNLETIAKLQNSSLALDIYIWLTYRFSTLRKPLDYPWRWIFDQFGADEFEDTEEGRKSFKQYFSKHLKRVLTEYPQANVTKIRGGIKLLPSSTHIPMIKQ